MRSERFPKLCVAFAAACLMSFIVATGAFPSARVQSTSIRRVLVMRLSAGGQTTRCSSKTLNSILFTDTLSVAKYFSENSYGLLTMSGDVVGPYTIRLSSADDIGKSRSQIAIARAADSAASAAGVNLSAYTDYVYMLPPYTSRPGG